MLDIKALKVALEQLEQEKKISHEKVVDAVEKSLAAAYQKEYGKRGQIVRSGYRTLHANCALLRRNSAPQPVPAGPDTRFRPEIRPGDHISGPQPSSRY